MGQQCTISYISNAGVFLCSGNNKVLIDGLCNCTGNKYKNLPLALRNKIVAGLPPYNNIDLLLITHHHPDHFDPWSTIRFAESNPNGMIIADQDVIQSILKLRSDLPMSRFIPANNPHGSKVILYNTDNLRVKAIPLVHDGEEFKNVRNIGYIIELEGKKILNVGDAKPSWENYINLMEENIDLLIAPFPYVSLASARRVIQKYIRPRKIAAVHFPYPHLDYDKWIDTTKASYKLTRDSFIETVFLEDIEDHIYI